MTAGMEAELAKEAMGSISRRFEIIRAHTHDLSPAVASRVPSNADLQSAEKIIHAAVALATESEKQILGFVAEWRDYDHETARSALQWAIEIAPIWSDVEVATKATLDFLDGYPDHAQLVTELRAASQALYAASKTAEVEMVKLRGSWTPKDPDRLAAGVAQARAGGGMSAAELIAAARSRRS